MDLSKLTVLAERGNDIEWLKRVTGCVVLIEKYTNEEVLEKTQFSSSSDNGEENHVDYVKLVDNVLKLPKEPSNLALVPYEDKGKLL